MLREKPTSLLITLYRPEADVSCLSQLPTLAADLDAANRRWY